MPACIIETVDTDAEGQGCALGTGSTAAHMRAAGEPEQLIQHLAGLVDMASGRGGCVRCIAAGRPPKNWWDRCDEHWGGTPPQAAQPLPGETFQPCALGCGAYTRRCVHADGAFHVDHLDTAGAGLLAPCHIDRGPARRIFLPRRHLSIDVHCDQGGRYSSDRWRADPQVSAFITATLAGGKRPPICSSTHLLQLTPLGPVAYPEALAGGGRPADGPLGGDVCARDAMTGRVLYRAYYRGVGGLQNPHWGTPAVAAFWPDGTPRRVEHRRGGVLQDPPDGTAALRKFDRDGHVRAAHHYVDGHYVGSEWAAPSRRVAR